MYIGGYINHKQYKELLSKHMNPYREPEVITANYGKPLELDISTMPIEEALMEATHQFQTNIFQISIANFQEAERSFGKNAYVTLPTMIDGKCVGHVGIFGTPAHGGYVLVVKY